MDAGQLRLVGLTILLPEEAKVKTRQNFQTSIRKISIGNSMICSDIWYKCHEWYFKIVIHNFTSR